MDEGGLEEFGIDLRERLIRQLSIEKMESFGWDIFLGSGR